ANDAVGEQADVSLEVPHGAIGPLPENAVRSAGVETQDVQASLEGEDVVTSMEGDPKVEHAVSQASSGFDQLLPRVRPHESVHQVLAPLLELSHRWSGRRPEPPDLLGVDVVAHG